MLIRYFISLVGVGCCLSFAAAATDMMRVTQKYEEIETATSVIELETANPAGFIQILGRSPDMKFEETEKFLTRYSWFFNVEGKEGRKDTLQFIVEVHDSGKVLSKETTLLCKH